MGKLFNVGTFAKKNRLQERNLSPIIDHIKERKITKIEFTHEEGGFWVDQLCCWLKKKDCVMISLKLNGELINDKRYMSKLKDALSVNTSLKNISFHGGNVEPKMLSDFIGFIQLNQTLESIGFVNIREGTISSLRGLMENNRIDSTDEITIENITRCMEINKNIVEIDFSVNNIGCIGALNIKEMMKNRNNFRKIKLNQCFIKNDGMIYITEGLKNNRNLSKLEIDLNLINEKGVIHLSSCFEFLTELRTLSIGITYFDKKGFSCLCEQLKHLKNLEKLNLQACQIDDNRFLLLTESLKHCCQLKILDVSVNQIVSGFDYLIGLLKTNSKLKTLNIRSNPISNEGVKKLNNCLIQSKVLKRLDIGGRNDENNIEEIIEMINSDNCLKTLSFCMDDIKDHHLLQIYLYLVDNTSLEELHLPISPMGLDTEQFKNLSRCLISNNSLIRIRLNGFSLIPSICEKHIDTIIRQIPKANRMWNSSNHHKLTFPAFQQSLHTFLLCLKANQFKTNLKIPRFVILEIIKFIKRKSFLHQSNKKNKLENPSTKKESLLKKLKNK
jgi:hypothetical protein